MGTHALSCYEAVAVAKRYDGFTFCPGVLRDPGG